MRLLRPLAVWLRGDKMPRSKYIYFVRKASPEHKLLGAFTVKHEANRWAFLNDWSPEHADLSRMRDGVHEDKTEDIIPWAQDTEGLVQ